MTYASHVWTLGGDDEDTHNLEGQQESVRLHSDQCCFAATVTIQGVRMVLSKWAEMSDRVRSVRGGLHASFSRR